MNEPRTFKEILELLSLLRQSEEISERQKDIADRLHTRLTSPVRVGVFGGMSTLVNSLFFGLVAATKTDTQISTDDSVQFDGFVVTRHLDTPAVGNVDIAVWATKKFDASEAAVWSTTSDRLKDHSFLIAIFDDTDRIETRDIPNVTTTWVDAALDDFAVFLALPMRQDAVQAQPLLSALSDNSRRGRQADQDSADLLIESLKDKIDQVKLSRSPSLEMAALVPKLAHSYSKGPDIWYRASEELKSRGRALSGLPLSNDTPPVADILAICIDASEALSQIFVEVPATENVPKRFQEDVLIAADSIVLMSLENSVGSAIDATTTLLQLQKDIQLQLSIG